MTFFGSWRSWKINFICRWFTVVWSQALILFLFQSIKCDEMEKFPNILPYNIYCCILKYWKNRNNSLRNLIYICLLESVKDWFTSWLRRLSFRESIFPSLPCFTLVQHLLKLHMRFEPMTSMLFLAHGNYICNKMHTKTYHHWPLFKKNPNWFHKSTSHRTFGTNT